MTEIVLSLARKMLFGQQGHFGNEGNQCVHMSLYVLGSEMQKVFGGQEKVMPVLKVLPRVCVTQRVCMLQQWVKLPFKQQ